MILIDAKITKTEHDYVELIHYSNRSRYNHPLVDVDTHEYISKQKVDHYIAEGLKLCTNNEDYYDCIVIGLTRPVEEALNFFVNDYKDLKKDNEKNEIKLNLMQSKLNEYENMSFLQRLKFLISPNKKDKRCE